MHGSISTVIIEPNALFREGLRRILEDAQFQPVWCSDYPPLGPIPALLDGMVPLLIVGAEIEEAIVHISEVKRFHPLARAILLSESVTRSQFLTALRHGAETVIPKRSSCEGLIATLKLVVEGAVVFPADLLTGLLQADLPATGLTSLAPPPQSPSMPPRSGISIDGLRLSPREMKVVRELSHGHSNKEIARDLDITEATVKVHVKSILRKAHVRNRTQIAMWASRQGLGGDLYSHAPPEVVSAAK